MASFTAMTANPMIVDEAESFLRGRVEELTQLRENECLCCYVARLLDEFPCDGSLRHALKYRDAVAPRATALKERLGRVGGYCDCEIFLNGYQLQGAADDEADVGYYEDTDDLINWDAAAQQELPGVDAEPEPLPPCQGVRRGSVKPCGNWLRIRRW
jgi:hypothetical protein